MSQFRRPTVKDGTNKTETPMGPGGVIEALRTAIQQAEAKTDEPVGEIVHQDTRHHGYAMAVRATDQTSKLLPLGTKLYTRTALGVPDDVVKDADRLDWLARNPVDALDIFGKSRPDEARFIRATIDAAMTAAQAQKGQV